MCKTYDAIFELSNYTESNILICSLHGMKIEGELHKCYEEMGQEECYKGIITLKNAKIHCSDGEKEYKWINIPSRHIQAFAFKCCEM